MKAGRTVATNGPLLFATVDDQGPGSELQARSEVTVDVDLATIAPVDVIEIVVDGTVVHSTKVDGDQSHVRFTEVVSVEGARWIAVRAHGGKARYSGDNYTFAHTTPVYFADAEPNEASSASAEFLTAVIEEIWRRVDQRDAWVRDEDRARYRDQLDEALSRLRAKGLR